MSLRRSGAQVRLLARPSGWPRPEDFDIVAATAPELADGEVLVRNRWLSVDPYMRGRMNAGPSYAPAYRVGEVMYGGATGTVIASRAPSLPEGEVVLHSLGWRELASGPASSFRKIDTASAPEQAYLGILGMPGMTAYVGMLTIARLREGDIAFVSGAAGAVGSLAGQIARLRGASRVVGSAGTDAKVSYLTGRCGFDAAFNYHAGPAAEQLAAAAPDGIDVYFDNVGGEQLEAALGALHPFGRVAACGSISLYNATAPSAGPRNLGLVVARRLTIRGFIVSDHEELRGQFEHEMSGWLATGAVAFQETIVDGIEHAIDAFLGLLRGDNVGKMLVRLAAESS
jgi:NADPH-dependent curcumin reductase CurA